MAQEVLDHICERQDLEACLAERKGKLTPP